MEGTSERPIRVVIADDHAVVRQGTRELLTHEDDIEVVGEAANGEEAVRIVQELNPAVAILDIAMPVLNGIEATRRIKEACPATRVLVLTAYDNDEYILAMVRAGAAGYILKTANYSELVSAVRSVYEGESVLDPTVAGKVWDRLITKLEEQTGRRDKGNGLTDRELQILVLAAKGLSNKEIAQSLALSWRTVQTHLEGVFAKLGVASRTEAVVKGLTEGWLHIEDLK